jgi:hypothetical protein
MNVCGAVDKTHETILLELIKQLLLAGEHLSLTTLEAKVGEYHRNEKPVGHDIFYELPAGPGQLRDLAGRAILEGIREGELIVSVP